MNRKQNSLMRFSRTERLAQLSEQEIVIERKKKEIQAKFEAQKKKGIEEALRKLESSNVTKSNAPGFSKKSRNGTEFKKTSHKEKPVEHVRESLTNAFSNDGSFLDHFKKLSQTGLSSSNVDAPTLSVGKNKKGDSKNNEENISKKESYIIRDKNKPVDDSSHSSSLKKPLDSKVQLQIPPPGFVQLVAQYQNVSVAPSAVSNTVSINPSFSVQASSPQNTEQNPVPAVNANKMQLNSLSSYPGIVQAIPHVPYKEISTCSNLMKQSSSSSVLSDNPSSTTPLASVQTPLSITTQSISPSSSVEVQNTLPSLKQSSGLPKLRSESISMTLKINANKKLEAIPNPLEVDQEPSPTSPKKNQFCFAEKKESSKLAFSVTPQNFNSKSILEKVSSEYKESSRISSAFYDTDEDEEEGCDYLDEKYQHWAELVARCGDEFEDSLRLRNENDANLRFLLDKNSKEYLSYRKLVLKYRKCLKSSEQKTSVINDMKMGHSETTEQQESKMCSEIQENQDDDKDDFLQNKGLGLITEGDCFAFSKGKSHKEENSSDFESIKAEKQRKRKRKSRWGDAVPATSISAAGENLNLQSPGTLPAPKSTLLSQLTRSDPGLIQYARQTFGSTNLSEEDWKKAEDHYKINLLYQDMVKKRAEVEKLERQGKFKYEYDSDEDTEGGTWEHKLRQQEMQATQLWAEELTKQAAGKHHIGDFLPPEELERFMEKYNAVKEGREPDLSDYKEYKLKQDNVGYRLLQKMGWNEGQGLGQDGSGITNPVNKATTRHENQGLGVERPDGLDPGDDEYDAYRKRMMLAYRFRPNPLNNPRRPYY